MRVLLFLLLLPILNAFSQERFEIKNIGFAMEAPENWLKIANTEVLNNLENYDFSEKQLNDFIKSNNSSLSFVTFTKHNPKVYAGIIPTIKVRALITESKNIQDFLKSVEKSNSEAKKTLEDFVFIEKPSAVKISNKDAIKFSVKFKLKNSGKEYEIVSRSYYFLRGGYYISLNFIEEFGKEDNTELFDKLIKSIIIN